MEQVVLHHRQLAHDALVVLARLFQDRRGVALKLAGALDLAPDTDEFEPDASWCHARRLRAPCDKNYLGPQAGAIEVSRPVVRGTSLLPSAFITQMF